MRTFILICTIALFASCEHNKTTTPIVYKYADQEQVVQCEAQDNALLNEALYSFEEDIKRNYDLERQRLTFSYARFIIPGMTGTAEFERLPSEHSKVILTKLLEEKIIVKAPNASSNLNYEHPAVSCIIDNIEDNDLKRTLKALLETNSMDPKLLDSRLRNSGSVLDKQRNLAMYVALEGYYQHLANVTFTVTGPKTE